MTTQHKVFISYYHNDDEFYKKEFEKLFNHLFIFKSINPGDIDPDNSDIYIKRLIQQEYIEDASVVIVLVGPNTLGRKHVDWEISAGLNSKLGGYSGLIGILLPKFQLSNNKFNYDQLPPRLSDNVKSGYAKIYTWDYACLSGARISNIVETAFNNRLSLCDKIDNSSPQFQRNR